jgi:FMN reductase
VTTQFHPRIVGLGGTLRPGSSSEKALRYALGRAESMGAQVEILTGDAIDLPAYVAESPARTPKVSRLIETLRGAHGVIVSSPGYHGSVTGLVKNALDYIEFLRDDAPAYMEGRAVGLIACAQGWQAAVSTLTTLRGIVHALRGWPTPLGVAFNTSVSTFDENDTPSDQALSRQLDLLAAQVMEFSMMRYRAFAESMAK